MLGGTYRQQEERTCLNHYFRAPRLQPKDHTRCEASPEGVAHVIHASCSPGGI